VSPTGEVLTEDEWRAKSSDWLPNDDDMQFISSLMRPCHQPGKYASWIAPPRVGVNNQPGDFEYVKIV
jgi:benzoyl-CoA 2,3-dioxygenase component B